jgi:hypothetical protein
MRGGTFGGTFREDLLEERDHAVDDCEESIGAALGAPEALRDNEGKVV